MSFDVEVGWFSAKGAREANEDFVAARLPAPGDEASALVAAIADGVSSGGRGREAAQTSVISLLEDYAATPREWDTTAALDRLIGTQNTWLADHNRRAPDAGLTTLTALVVCGHGYTLAHVGDTRAWLVRSGECTQLTQDHRYDQPDEKHRLTRAVGLDDRVRVDYLQGDLQVGDVLLLTSDGAHDLLHRAALARLACAGDAPSASRAIVAAALEAGSRDNASALVLRVRGLAAASLEDAASRARRLPLPPRLRIGDRLDGYIVTALLADNGVHRLVQARDVATQRLVAIKTLHEASAGDPEERAMLAHEAWLGARVGGRRDATAGAFVDVRENAGASAFYVVFDWHAGRTLEQRLAGARRFEMAEVVAGALAVARALGRLHRLGIVHRDLKPANLHFGDDGVWRILDLGVALSGREPEALRELQAGTPSYMNPEQWSDAPARADAASDLYALGVTLYRWLTGKLPYGEIEPWQRARFRHDPKPPSRLAPEVPVWLDRVVLKAVALDARLRFQTAEEFALALERGAARALTAPSTTPLVRRDPAALAKVALVISLVFNVLLVIWLLFLPR